MKLQSIALTFVLAAAPTAALAQQPQRPSDDEINARIQAISSQRNAAQDQVAALAAALQTAQAELATAKKAAEVCKPKVEEKKK
mgnify:CR=1 FL=1